MSDNKDLDQLEEKIRQARGDERKRPTKSSQQDNDNMKQGLHAGLEFAGAIFLPTFVGYWIDQWLGTFPAFFIGLFFLGILTGFYNIWRVMQNLGTGVGYSQLHRTEKDAKNAPDLDESEQNKE